MPRTMAVVPSWIEAHAVVPDGFRKGEPLRLYDWQLRWFANYYLVRPGVVFDPHRPILAPAFVYRRGLMVGPQKLGKDPCNAAHICAEGVGPVLFAGWAGPDDGYACSDHGCGCGWEYPYDPGEPMGMQWPTPLIQITAFSEEQTANTYDALRPMIDGGPLADLIPKTGEAFIRLPGGGRIDTVTSSAQSRLGQRVTFVTQGEVGLWTPRNKMTRVADTQYRGLAGMGGRAALNTNAWDPSEESVAKQQYESPAADIYRQFDHPPAKLSYGDKRERHKIHLAVYPPDTLRENGGHIDLDAIENEAADLASRDLPQAARFYGNLLMAGAGVAIDPDEWDALARPQEVPAKTPIGIGFDGSIRNDVTSIRGCTAEGYSFDIGKWVRPHGAAMDAWRAAHPGQDWVIPRDEVRARMTWAREYYSVCRVLCDPPKWWTEIDDWTEEFGLIKVPHTDADGKTVMKDEPIVRAFDTNQPSRMAPAVDRWRTGNALGEHTHDGDPVTSEHVKNAHLRKVKINDVEDDRTMYVLVKGDDHAPIDCGVADVLAYEAAMTMPPPAPAGTPMVW